MGSLAACERVQDGVEVRRHVHAVHFVVVSDVDDHGEIATEERCQAAGEPGTSDPARQEGDRGR